MKVKRYIREMATDIKEKIRTEAHDSLSGEEYIERIDRIIYHVEAGLITNIEAATEILTTNNSFRA